MCVRRVLDKLKAGAKLNLQLIAAIVVLLFFVFVFHAVTPTFAALHVVAILLMILAVYRYPKGKRLALEEKMFIWVGAWVFFLIYLLSGSVAYFAFAAGIGFIAYNRDKKKNDAHYFKKIDVTMIILTLLILQLSWLLVHPRLEILSVDEPNIGYLHYLGDGYSEYVTSRFTIQVTPPLIPIRIGNLTCNDEHLGAQVTVLTKPEDLDVYSLKSGTLRVCSRTPYSLEPNKNIIVVDVTQKYADKFNVYPGNISVFHAQVEGDWTYNFKHIRFQNLEDFPVVVRSVYMEIPRGTAAWNLTTGIQNSSPCTVSDNEFTLKTKPDSGSGTNLVNITKNDSIELSTETWFEVSPNNSTYKYVVLTDANCSGE